MDNFADFSVEKDEQLVKFIRLGNDKAFKCLYERYLPKMKTMAYSFQGLSLEIEDLIQEAAIGFYTAINAYDEKSEASFSTFCYLCMRRMLIGLLKKASRKKTIPESKIVNLDIIQNDLVLNPENIIIANEDFKALKNKIFNKLSLTEREVLFKYLGGYNYEEIAESLNIPKKSVDNALQRVKKKIQ